MIRLKRRPCLNCGWNLFELPADATGGVTCPCGASYSSKLIETASRKSWNKVRRLRAFTREPDGALIVHSAAVFTMDYTGQ